jgi:uncharacterized protein (TIGR00369 family)
VREAPRPDLAAALDAAMNHPGFIRALGVRLVSHGHGAAELALVPRPDMLQFTGAVHAGVVTALADHAAGGAAATVLPEGQIAVTAELKINFLAPARGEQLVARATVERAGRTLVVASSAVFARQGGTEVKCAVALVTLTPVPLRPPARV